MALDLRGYPFADVARTAADMAGVCGLPVWDPEVFVDVATLAASWADPADYPDDARPCRPLTESEFNAAAVAMETRDADLAAFLARDAANKIDAAALRDRARAFVAECAAVVAQANAFLSTYGTNWSAMSNAELIAAAKVTLPALIQSAKAAAARDHELARALALVVERELRKG